MNLAAALTGNVDYGGFPDGGTFPEDDRGTPASAFEQATGGKDACNDDLLGGYCSHLNGNGRLCEVPLHYLTVISKAEEYGAYRIHTRECNVAGMLYDANTFS